MTRRFLLFSLMALTLAACAAKPSADAQTKRYPMEGTIKALDPQAKTALIDAGKIGDWMEAMTMEYAVKPDAEFAKLKVGDHIKATVVVQDVKYYVTDVTVLPH
jgi:Cu/Ag efflux protein CusF